MQQQAPLETSAEALVDKDQEPPGKRFKVRGNIQSSIQKICNSITPRHSIFPPNTKRKAGTNPNTRTYRRIFFPDISEKEWNDWRWQIRNRIHTLSQLSRFLKLSQKEQSVLELTAVPFPMAITPYYLSLLSPVHPDHPLRKTVVPTLHELFKMPCESDDPLGEENQSPVNGLVHRYPDRLLLLVTDFCSTYCRYCTRSRVVGHGTIHSNRSRLEKAIDYIKNTTSVRDVLLSGGDPLTMSDERLEWLLQQLRQIPHLDIIRFGTKVPAVLPQRITPKLVRMLKKYHPLWMSLHFIHPEECTPEAYRACDMLANAGIPLGSQTVLLKGINDSVATIRDLMHHLLRMRVRPYYLYQCDPISGSGHFRTTVEKGLEIIRGLRGYTTGYAVPTYVIDAPGGGGKIPLMPNYNAGREGDFLLIRNYENRIFRYPDIQPQNYD
jgi:lysine 2,3-aminomutase